jgi:hypothetical protein
MKKLEWENEQLTSEYVAEKDEGRSFNDSDENYGYN